MASGADVNARDGYGRTPAHVAAFASQDAAVTALAKAAGGDAASKKVVQQATQVVAKMTPAQKAQLAKGLGGSAGLGAMIRKLVSGKPTSLLGKIVKDDFGNVTYPSKIPLAKKVHRRIMRDPKKMLEAYHKAGIYVIARITAFKDSKLPLVRPDPPPLSPPQ